MKQTCLRLLLTSQKKQELTKQLLVPIVSKFESLLQRMVTETDEAKQLAYCESLTQAMSLARSVCAFTLSPHEAVVVLACRFRIHSKFQWRSG